MGLHTLGCAMDDGWPELSVSGREKQGLNRGARRDVHLKMAATTNWMTQRALTCILRSVRISFDVQTKKTIGTLTFQENVRCVCAGRYRSRSRRWRAFREATTGTRAPNGIFFPFLTFR